MFLFLTRMEYLSCTVIIGISTEEAYLKIRAPWFIFLY